jgi:hypothetical protein
LMAGRPGSAGLASSRRRGPRSMTPPGGHQLDTRDARPARHTRRPEPRTTSFSGADAVARGGAPARSSHDSILPPPDARRLRQLASAVRLSASATMTAGGSLGSHMLIGPSSHRVRVELRSSRCRRCRRLPFPIDAPLPSPLTNKPLTHPDAPSRIRRCVTPPARRPRVRAERSGRASRAALLRAHCVRLGGDAFWWGARTVARSDAVSGEARPASPARSILINDRAI